MLFELDALGAQLGVRRRLLLHLLREREVFVSGKERRGGKRNRACVWERERGRERSAPSSPARVLFVSGRKGGREIERSHAPSIKPLLVLLELDALGAQLGVRRRLLLHFLPPESA